MEPAIESLEDIEIPGPPSVLERLLDFSQRQVENALLIFALIVILAAGYGLRAVGRNWDDFTHLHPDERFLTDVASRLGTSPLQFPADQQSRLALCNERYPAPESLENLTASEREYRLSRVGRGGYFDAECSDLSPNNIGFGLYVYGEFPMFTTRIVAETVREVEYDHCIDGAGEDSASRSECSFLRTNSPRTAYNGIHLVGRTISSAADSVSIVLVFLVAFKLLGHVRGGRWMALLAAGFYAFAAFPIQQSHFWTVDAFTGTWVMLTIYAAVNVLDDDARRPALFSPLAWIAAGIGVWVLEVAQVDAPLISFGIYGVVFGLSALASTTGDEIKLGFVTVAGWILLAVAVALGHITVMGFLGAAILLILLAMFAYLGLHRAAAYGGTAVWLMAAIGLWVYDGLAHYQNPGLAPLALYLVIFTAGSVLASLLYRARNAEDALRWLFIIGIPLVVWALLDAMVGALSLQGTLMALVIVMGICAGTAFGYRDYVTFGVAFGAALASRVNVLPLVGVLLLAVMIQSMPMLDRKAFSAERYRIATRAMTGLMLAGVTTLFFFRILEPHAFNGFYSLGNFGFIPVGLNEGWLQDVDEARRLVSGAVDIPPNHQWANRTRWIFPLQNIVLYGLGPALGIAGWLGVLAALWFTVRNRARWTRVILLAAWIAVYFGWLGGNWVTTMRYFLPIYGSLAILAAWALVGFVTWAAQQPDAEHPRRASLARRTAPALSGLLLLGVVVYTILYGYGMTHIYRNLLTRVSASLYMQQNVPGNLGLWIEGEDGSRQLQNIGTSTVSSVPDVQRLEDTDALTFPLDIPDNAILQSVVLHRLADPLHDEEHETIRLRIQQSAGLLFPETVAERVIEQDLNESLSDFGDEYSIRFDDEGEPTELSFQPATLAQPGSYQLEVKIMDGGPVLMSRSVNDGILPTTLHHITVYFLNAETDEPFIQEFTIGEEERLPPFSFYMPSQRSQTSFNAIGSGIIQSVEIPHVADPLGDTDEETLFIEITGTSGEVSYGSVTDNFLRQDDGINTFGPSVSIELDPPLRVTEGELYTITLGADSPLMTLGNAVAVEGPWDDPLPYKVCPLPDGAPLADDTESGYSTYTCNGVDMFGAHYYGVELFLAAEDDETKRQTLIDGLNEADYLTISSNRFYDSLSRLPTRWPLTLDYYEALFSGELGFELVREETSFAQFGPLVWRDQVLPTDDLPDWLNEFEVEEAFTVYDHPTVFIFRKTEDYDPDRTREILSTNLRSYSDAFGGLLPDETPVNRNVVTAPQASAAPNALMLSDAAREAQRRSTWRDLFDPDALINSNQVVAVVLWWALMMLVGWMTFPLLFAIFPGLPDRGFAAGKFIGWLIVAWLAWLGGALHQGTWSQGGILLAIILLTTVSAALTFPRRDDLLEFLRRRCRHLLALEAMSLVLFLIFLFIRLKNPDLWHSTFGGEKPMDFAYFNAVLRSEVFPPLDPWFSGGFINYYYWGFVLVGAPVKLMGIVPAIGYNLIVPTLFSMTAMGAFSVAYNLVAARQKDPHSPENPVGRRPPRANPWVAGIAALLLVTVLGNLDTARVFFTEVAKVGGYEGPGAYSLTTQRRNSLMNDFRESNEREPNPEELAAIEHEAQNPPIGAGTVNGVNQWLDLTTGFTRGFGDVMGGAPLQMHTHRWYWAPTRVIAELPEGRGHNAINEMPWFTFLYGDLHAHMMSMPIMLTILLWLAAEILGAGKRRRGWVAAGMSLFVGGLSVGLIRATNSWDWPTFLILGIAGLTFAAWITQSRYAEEHPAADSVVAKRLMRFLDLRHSLRLWWLVWLIPLGMWLHASWWVVSLFRYDARRDAGQIPVQCQDLPAGLRIPAECHGLTEPVWRLADSLAWAFALPMLGVLMYVTLLVMARAHMNRNSLTNWLGRVAVFVGVSLVTVLPFTANYAAHAAIIPWESDRTPLWAYLDIHGLFLFIFASFVIWQTMRLLRRFTVGHLVGLGLPALLVMVGAPLTLFIALIVGLTSVPVMLVTLPLIAWATGLFLVPGTSHVERVVYALMVLGLGLTTGVELVVLDIDIGRQNTVFKFYLEAWILFGISGGVALAWLLNALGRWFIPLRIVWQTMLAALVTIAFLYPIMATQARWIDRFNASATGMTLDGQAYMQHAVYGDNNVWFNTVGDYHMINWLLENIEGTPTIIEAQTTEYKWGARIAINTGLPTVMGWNWHQRQQRNVLDLNNVVWNRTNNVAAFYNTPSMETAWDLIQFYDIEYIIVGVLERVTYNDLIQQPLTMELESGLSPGISKFDRMVEHGLLEVVYEADTCVMNQAVTAEDCPEENIVTDRVYRVVPDAVYDVASR